MGLNRLDKVILILPVLGVFDVLSTLYGDYLGYTLDMYEAGFLARFFARHGLLYFYIPVYLGIVVGMAWLLCRITKAIESFCFVGQSYLSPVGRSGMLYICSAVGHDIDEHITLPRRKGIWYSAGSDLLVYYRLRGNAGLAGCAGVDERRAD